MTNNTKKSRKAIFNNKLLMDFNTMVRNGFTFLYTEAFEEIKESIELSERDGKSVFIVLDRTSDFTLIYNNIIIESDIITVNYHKDNNITEVAFICSSDDSMHPELTVLLDGNQYFYIDNTQSDIYDIKVDTIPTHMAVMIDKITDLFPIIKTEDYGMQIVDNTLSYVTDIKAYLNTTMVRPVIVSQLITPASKGEANHFSKLGYFISEFKHIDNEDMLTHGSIIVVKEETYDSIYTVCDFSDHVMICTSAKDNSTVEIPYSIMLNDYATVIPAYIPVFYNCEDKSTVKTLNDVIPGEEFDEESVDHLNSLFNFRSCYDGIDMNKIRELCGNKHNGKRVDTKRNKNILALKKSVESMKSLYLNYNSVIEKFKLEHIILYTGKRIIIFNEDNILKDYYNFKDILRILGVKNIDQ